MSRPAADDSWSDDGDITGTDFNNSSTYRTDLNDTQDTSECDSDAGFDASPTGPTWLLEGNEHPLEYYKQLLKNFDDSEYTKEGYSNGTTLLLDRSEAQWYHLT
ncbi:hypothetical protein P152DRAFT_460160 [Eremomyces bilateralis CBS 781.70]|uniref:Uncharacterized protein n=1 Tax=Eremomyces bilateralis CBS 781.70 TaxID=1392243 RepID=A0A6G1FYJ5_9PEZI|nr:uncharacterized protein P152DRAFT_460160 [Eremomyces bilateralis CBS 781.70]KAF1810863.1 hypothetical protein P152DRAFT_460160 [Eremomyces bilateralis CBS 781.70]